MRRVICVIFVAGTLIAALSAVKGWTDKAAEERQLKDPTKQLMVQKWTVINANKMFNIVDPKAIPAQPKGGPPLPLSVPFKVVGGKPAYQFSETNVKDELGLPGQNNTDPASLFNNHALVKVGTELWDPSYGAIYTSLLDFQQKAIFGYYTLDGKINNQLKMTIELQDPSKLDLVAK